MARSRLDEEEHKNCGKFFAILAAAQTQKKIYSPAAGKAN